MTVSGTGLKRLLIGRPRESGEMHHQLLPKWMALPVFSSDALSSTAYATQEMMLVLAMAGAAALANVIPLSLGVAALLIVVVVSYRQTVRAYPRGGGAYIVARENLGELPGLTAAAALLIDYTLTVAVSVAAGVAAVTSAFPVLASSRVTLALLFVTLVTLANLRGVREAGLVFALPTYLFVATMLTMIVWGLAQCVGGCPQAPSAGTPLPAPQTLGLFLLLRAFSSGATALTGVEAIADGVAAFRYPQSANAAATLGVMGIISVTMFLGISFLAHATGIVATEESVATLTVNAELALTVFGGPGIGFFLVQFVTAAILILAANTAFADFPRLASVLATDRYLPRQFVSRGDRLVFSNGIVLLAVGASLLVVIFRAQLTALIQLYVVGVFTSFTLSQLGMVQRHRRRRSGNWRRAALINGVGGSVTGVILVVVAVTKFLGGAWMVLVGIPLLVVLMRGIHRHYEAIRLQLRSGVAQLDAKRPVRVAIVVDGVDEAAARAISYARAIGAVAVRAYALAAPAALADRWAALAPDVDLQIVDPAAGDPVDRVRDALVAEADEHPDCFVVALVAETFTSGWLQQLRRERTSLRTKTALLREPRVVVSDLTAPDAGPGPYTLEEPTEHHVVVCVSAVNKATLRALAYGRSLHATSLRALSINLETERTARLLEQWEDWGLPVALEVVDSPFRSITETLRRYVQNFRPDGRRVIVTVVLPEFVLPRWYHQPLHNQTALLMKGALLFQRGAVTTSVPYQIVAKDGDVEGSSDVEVGRSAV